MRSRSRKSLVRNPLTSLSVSGPPIFSIKMPVLGLEAEAESSEAVALHRDAEVKILRDAIPARVLLFAFDLKVVSFISGRPPAMLLNGTYKLRRDIVFGS